MTDEIKHTQFKAPPMPTGSVQLPTHKTTVNPSTVSAAPTVKPEQRQVEGQAQTQSAGNAENPYADNFAADLNLPPKVLQTKIIGPIVAGIFFFGLMVGCSMSGGSRRTVVQGLTDVVGNMQIRPGMRRCGQIDPNRECILYVMNSKNYDRLAEDFFQEAQEMTGVPKYSIQLSNTQYANQLIQPGWIAQIYIPARN